MPTIFYSWQSDRPNKCNRSLICRALDHAVQDVGEQAVGVEDALRVDQDAEGVAGSPPIAETILRKIDAAAVFVPDMTLVTEDDQGRPSPNPNVLIEYGYALKSLGDERIIPVLNTAYGSWERLPFDMRHKRRPLLYEAFTDSTASQRKAARGVLTNRFSHALRLALDTRPDHGPPPAIDLGRFRQLYHALLPEDDFGGTMLGMLIVLVPETLLAIGDLPSREVLFRRSPGVTGQFPTGGPLQLFTMDEPQKGMSVGGGIRPGLTDGVRVAQRIWRIRFETRNEQWENDVSSVRVWETGEIAVFAKTTFLHGLSVR